MIKDHVNLKVKKRKIKLHVGGGEEIPEIEKCGIFVHTVINKTTLCPSWISYQIFL